jgi:hypothetical protein
VDLETISYPERPLVPASIDAELARIVAALPSGATLVPWWRLAHPATWLYGTAVALALVIALATLAATRRGDPLAPFGALCLLTLAVLGLDVMTGSRLQLDTPFGLSMIQSGRYYGIGNAALGSYGVTALFGAKVGRTIALVAIFALISYFAPVTGKSHLAAFAGDVLHVP